MSVRRQSKERQILMPSAPFSCDVRSEKGVLVGEAPSRCSTHVLGTVEQLNLMRETAGLSLRVRPSSYNWATNWRLQDASRSSEYRKVVDS
jgi:hypothetical protein